jgi:Ser/Thr protein kinase RdoA (MazF antagonist)
MIMTLEKSVADWKQELASKKDVILQEIQHYIPIETLEEISGPVWNTVFCGKGKATKYCVKVLNEESLPVDWTLEELAYVGKVMSALREANFNYVLPPLPLKDGSYSCRLAGYTIIVFPWFEAFEYDAANNMPGSTLETYVSAATPILYELHRQGRVAAETLDERNSSFPRIYSPQEWANAAIRLWEECRRSMSKIGVSEEVFSVVNKAQKDAEEIVERFPDFFFALPKEETIVHGDFRPENILIQTNCVQLVYDFDFVRVGNPEEDIAYSALYCSGSSWFSGSRDWKVCADFIAKYQKSARANNDKGIKKPFLEAALYWTIFKELSLSFDAEGVIGRYCLLNELKENLSWILPS